MKHLMLPNEYFADIANGKKTSILQKPTGKNMWFSVNSVIRFCPKTRVGVDLFCKYLDVVVTNLKMVELTKIGDEEVASGNFNNLGELHKDIFNRYPDIYFFLEPKEKDFYLKLWKDIKKEKACSKFFLLINFRRLGHID